jgi:hypothetical protein
MASYYSSMASTNYGNGGAMYQGIIMIIIVCIVVFLLLMLIGREVINWYLKHNAMLK